MGVFDNILRYGKSVSLYFSALLIPMFLNLATNPMIAKNMSPTDYAITGYYTAFNSLLSPLILFFMMNYYIKEYYRVDETQRTTLQAIIVKALIYFSLIITVICCTVLIIYLKVFNKESQIPLSPYVYLSVFSLPFLGIYSLLLADYRISRNSKGFFNLSISNGVILVLAALLFVVVLKMGALGKLLSTLLVNIGFFIWCCWHYRDSFKIKFDYRLFNKIIKFCFPLTLAATLGFFSSGFDRILLEKQNNITELGYYVVGAQIASYLSVFATAMSSTFQPDIYESIASKNYKLTAKFGFLLVLLVSICVIVFIICAPFLIHILTAGRYMLSVSYVRIFALSAITSTMYYAISQFTMGIDKTGITLINRIISSIIIIAMFVLAIKYYGFIGAAWGVVFSFVILFIGNILILIIYKRLKTKSNVENSKHK